jgi:hypothetical protein
MKHVAFALLLSGEWKLSDAQNDQALGTYHLPRRCAPTVPCGCGGK